MGSRYRIQKILGQCRRPARRNSSAADPLSLNLPTTLVRGLLEAPLTSVGAPLCNSALGRPPTALAREAPNLNWGSDPRVTSMSNYRLNKDSEAISNKSPTEGSDSLYCLLSFALAQKPERRQLVLDPTPQVLGVNCGCNLALRSGKRSPARPPIRSRPPPWCPVQNKM